MHDRTWEHSYLALTGDLDASKDMPEKTRARAQNFLIRLLQDFPSAPLLQPDRTDWPGVSQDLRSDPRAHGMVTSIDLGSGDRIQTLFRLGKLPDDEPSRHFRTRQAADRVAECILHIALRCAEFTEWDLRFTFGLGLGPVTTAIAGDDVGRVDGPCFHRAEEALTIAKKDRIFLSACGFGVPRGQASLSGEDLTVSGMFSVLGGLIQGWTARQAEFVRESLPNGFIHADPDTFELEAMRSRTDVAQRLGVSLPTVSKSLSAAQLSAVSHGAFAAAWFLAEVWERSSRESARRAAEHGAEA